MSIKIILSLVSVVVSSNDPQLNAGTGDGRSSPWVIAIKVSWLNPRRKVKPLTLIRTPRSVVFRTSSTLLS